MAKARFTGPEEEVCLAVQGLCHETEISLGFGEGFEREGSRAEADLAWPAVGEDVDGLEAAACLKRLGYLARSTLHAVEALFMLSSTTVSMPSRRSVRSALDRGCPGQ